MSVLWSLLWCLWLGLGGSGTEITLTFQRYVSPNVKRQEAGSLEVKGDLCPEATGLGRDSSPQFAFSWEFLCADHPMWLLSISEFVGPTTLASPELVRFVMRPLVLPTRWTLEKSQIERKECRKKFGDRSHLSHARQCTA